MSSGHSNVHSSIGRNEMSILDIQMPIRPLDEWTLSDGKDSSLSYPHGVVLSHVTLLQLPCMAL